MKISFNRRTLGTEIQADMLIEEMVALLPDAMREKYAPELRGNAGWLISQTRPGSVELNEAEARIEEYQTFKAFTDALDPKNARAMYEGYLNLDQKEIVPLWIEAFANAHKPLVPKVQQDGRLLTDEEKAAQSDPENPLPVTA